MKVETYVTETPGVCGSYPCIANTRIPVRLIVEFFRETPDVPAILAIYSQLSREQVEGALAYYAAYPERVDEDIERNACALAELRPRSIPAPTGRPR